MPPYTARKSTSDEGNAHINKDWSLCAIWRDFSDWIVRLFQGINNETLEHPYFIAFALFVVWAWPHLLMLPVWFSKDAYRIVDDHARNAVNRVAAPVRRRKRDVFLARYRSVVNASYEPEERAPLFGGTPLSDGNFAIEEEHHLPVTLRVIRWSALAWAAFILGRELYFLLSR
ncbi:hypothetical protein M0805_003219 [Coniferiporia weirii]|nr:hypothetical protein M0805_003219 [Coniferiporia weirii]